MRKAVLFGAAAAMLVCGAQSAQANCTSNLASVIVYDTDAAAAVVSSRSRFTWGQTAGELDRAFQLTTFGNLIFTDPVQGRLGFRLAACLDATAAVNVTLFTDYSWNFPGTALRFQAGGRASLDVGVADLQVQVAGTWLDWTYTSTGLEFAADVPVGKRAGDLPQFVISPSLTLTLAGGSASPELGLAVVRPMSSGAAFLASVGHPLGGGWSFGLGVQLPLQPAPPPPP